MKHVELFEDFLNEAVTIKTLYDKIYSASKERNDGAYSYVVYLHGDKKMSISTYEELVPYSAQITDSNNHLFKIIFSDSKNKTQVTFTNNVEERMEDRKSFDKYGGLIYIFEPITDKIATEISKKVFLFKK